MSLSGCGDVALGVQAPMGLVFRRRVGRRSGRSPWRAMTSAQLRTDHPLRFLVADVVGATRSRPRDLLAPAPGAAEFGRNVSAERYTSSALWGEKVLLIDDTWTTGNHAQSAAAALKAAGAGSVAILVLGRHLDISYGDTAAHVEQARLRRFTWDVCVLLAWSHT
jgi:phosphoribosylpyrophosphate synthetase